MTEDLILQNWQVQHYYKILNILKCWHVYLDKSPTGSGKTYVTIAIAKSCNLQLLIVCPPIMESKWRDVAEYYNVNIVDILSYHKLAGKSKEVSHNYLTRNEDGFQATDYLKQIFSTPTLLVIDEVHNVKNFTSLRSLAVHELIKEVVRSSICRAGLLSATPFDKESHADVMLKMMGFLMEDGYKSDSTGRYITFTGIERARKICIRWERWKKEYRLPTRRADYDTYCYNLLHKVVFPRISSRMPAPILPFTHDIADGFYQLSEEDSFIVVNAARRIQRGLRGGMDSNGNICGKLDWGEITLALMELERAKFKTMIRLAKEVLTDDPCAKVILAANYINTIKSLYDGMSEYNPRMIMGETTKSERRENINLFQQTNTDLRVLIINPNVGGVGIDLDDIHGGFPRYMFMLPTFHMISVIQMIGRIYRSLTKSQPHTRMIYARNYEEECRILNNLMRKTKIMHEITEDYDILFPGDYPRVYS